MPSTHSILAPSASSRWLPCPGSLVAEAAQPPSPPSEAAREGELVHQLGAGLIDLGCRGLLLPDWRTVTHSEAITDDMRRAAHGYAWEVFRVLRTLNIFGGPHLGIEQRLEIPAIHPTMIGTPDAWVYSPRDNILVIWDLKYGFMPVEPFENSQVACYLSGLISKGVPIKHETKIQFRIYQPRAPHPLGIRRLWKTTFAGVKPLLDELRAAANAALGDDPRTSTGDHCRYCRARHACTALQRDALDASDYTGTPMPDGLTPRGLAVELAILERSAKLLEYRLDAIREYAAAELRAGRPVPGYRLAEGRGSTVWSLSDADVIATGDAMGVDVRKRGVLTPKQAIDDAGMDADLVAAMTERRAGKKKVKADDGSAARMVFGGGDDGQRSKKGAA